MLNAVTNANSHYQSQNFIRIFLSSNSSHFSKRPVGYYSESRYIVSAPFDVVATEIKQTNNPSGVISQLL